MKYHIWSRAGAAGCCAALCLVLLLGGCGGQKAATSTAAPSSQSLSQAPASEAVPSGEDDTQPAPTTPQVDDTENSWNGLSDPTSAFSGCLGWGPGTAGSSLKSAAAAASMMEWADANGLAGRSGSSVRDCLAGWYDGLDTFDQENVAECWPLIQQSAQRILDDPEGAATELSDAGVQEVPACSQEDWSALAGALNAIVPEPMQ